MPHLTTDDGVKLYYVGNGSAFAAYKAEIMAEMKIAHSG